MSIDDTRAAYDRYAEREWNRLEGGAQHRLEFLITQHALQRHLLPLNAASVHILDAGGGPGRYAMLLAKAGFDVTLFDLSPQLLGIAREKIHDLPASVRARVRDVIEGSVTDLSRFPNEAFDVTLCLGGPLSHVVDADERRHALAELSRVTKRGAPVFVSVMGKFGAFRSAVQWPDWFGAVFPHIAGSGVVAITSGGAPCRFFSLDEFVSDLKEVGFSVEHLYGCQGVGAHLDEANLLALMADPDRWPQWRDVLLSTCDRPEIIGVSNHILAVVRNPG